MSIKQIPKQGTSLQIFLLYYWYYYIFVKQKWLLCRNATSRKLYYNVVRSHRRNYFNEFQNEKEVKVHTSGPCGPCAPPSPGGPCNQRKNSFKVLLQIKNNSCFSNVNNFFKLQNIKYYCVIYCDVTNHGLPWMTSCLLTLSPPSPGIPFIPGKPGYPCNSSKIQIVKLQVRISRQLVISHLNSFFVLPEQQN